jgi:hypothetical protein
MIKHVSTNAEYFYFRYNARYEPAVHWGEDWHNTCHRFLDYLFVLYMVNFLHPGFQRSLPPPIQIMCSERILFAMNLDNLLLAEDLVWLHNGSKVGVTSRLLPVMVPPGFAVTEISNT